MSESLTVHNRARSQRLNLVFLRRIIRCLLRELLGADVRELGIYVVGEEEMTKLNETFLRHKGVTDVITFNYAEHPNRAPIQGEIFICIDEARLQAKRFGASWQQELVRYALHGILHLLGYDDRRKADRLRMKRQENRLLKQLADAFCFEALAVANAPATLNKRRMEGS